MGHTGLQGLRATQAVLATKVRGPALGEGLRESLGAGTTGLSTTLKDRETRALPTLEVTTLHPKSLTFNLTCAPGSSALAASRCTNAF